MRTVVLASMLSGVFLALLGAILGVLLRRPEISLTEVLFAGSSLATHPERFVRPSIVKPMKMLNLVGVLLFLLGIVLVLSRAITGGRLD